MYKKILFIDLQNKKAFAKNVEELNKYIGGVGVGLKILSDHVDEDPLILSTGPLNGFFPFASKTSIVFNSDAGVEDFYIGGSLSSRIRFAGLDSIVLLGRAAEDIVVDILDDEVTFRQPQSPATEELGLPGRRSVLTFTHNRLFLDDYFVTAEDNLERKFVEKKINSLVLTGTKTYVIGDKERYKELYAKILDMHTEITVEKSNYPSCSGCPMGCAKSRIGEVGGNVLIHSLVACTFAQKIYENISMAFSCLNVLGYDYTHEDIESFPRLVNQLLKEIA